MPVVYDQAPSSDKPKNGRHRPRTAEERARIGAAQRGRKKSPEHIAKMRENAKKQWADPTIREKMTSEERNRKISEGNKGKPKSAEHRRKIGEANKRRAFTPEMRENYAKAQRGKRLSEETKRKVGAKSKGHAVTPEMRERISNGNKRRWRELPNAEKERRVARLVASREKGKHDSAIERMVEEALTTLEVPFLRKQSIGRYRPDFLLPQCNLVIECDGDYWHDPKRQPQVAARDQRRDAFMNARGYAVVRLQESAIRRGALALIQQTLGAFPLHMKAIPPGMLKPKAYRMSDATRQRMAEAQRARWARTSPEEKERIRQKRMATMKANAHEHH